MKTALKQSAFVFVLAAACAAAACGGGNAELSPTGPSAGGGSSTSGATIIGRVNGGSGLAQTTSTMGTSSAAGLTVTIAGTTISTQVDGAGQFTLSGVPSGPVQLEFRGPGVNATITITVSGTEQIQIAVTVSGNSARVESQHNSGANNRGEVRGRITAIDATARTLRVAGTQVTVPADATIRNGSRQLQFSDLITGDNVEVRGTIDGATLRASEIKVESESRERLTEREGKVSNLSGTCPTLMFSVGQTRVTTTGSTYFKEGKCSNVRNGTSVEVKGEAEPDGSLRAVQVELDDDDDDDDDDDRDDDDRDDDDDDEDDDD